jgi:hypothetical protein
VDSPLNNSDLQRAPQHAQRLVLPSALRRRNLPTMTSASSHVNLQQ